VCHHGHRVHPDDRRHHRDDRRTRRHHRDGRRNRQRHPERHPDDREHHHERDAHLGDQPPHDRASCPGSGGARQGEDRRHQQEPGGHPAGGAFPGWEQRGCCPDEQPAGHRGPLEARDLRGRCGAFPGSARRGCFRGEGLRGEARGEARRRHPHVPQAPRGREPWAQASWQQGPWQRRTWEQAPGVTAPWVTARPDEMERAARQRMRGRGPRPQEQRGPQEPQLPGPRRGPARRALRWQRVQQVQAWLPTSWRQVLPPRPWQDRRRLPAPRGTTHEPYGPLGARWSMKPTGRTLPVLSDD
jgi:hypothetical protein